MLVVLCVFGCRDQKSGGPAGMDAAPTDSGPGQDSGLDGEPGGDGAVDSGSDGGPDGAVDGGLDSGSDAGADSGKDGGVATCTPIGTLIPGSQVSSTNSQSENLITYYGCTALAQSGPEIAYGYLNQSAGDERVTVTLADLEVDLDLFLLRDDCTAASCVAHSVESGTSDEIARSVLAPGQFLFVVVDGFAGAAGPFQLLLETETIEVECADGLDSDGDGLTDCADQDCSSDALCAQLCVDEGPLLCAEEIVSTTAGQTSQIDFYAGYDADFRGPERIYRFSPGAGEMALELSLVPSDLAQGLALVILEGECSSVSLLEAGNHQTVVIPLADQDYFVVVDGPTGGAGEFTLTSSCREQGCQNGLDDDIDGATDCADKDCQFSADCLVPCVPLSADAGCPQPDAGPDSGANSLACYLLGTAPLTGFCHQPGDAGVGAPCQAQYDCRADLVCTPADFCLPACLLDAGPDDCTSGSCTPIGANPLGVCY